MTAYVWAISGYVSLLNCSASWSANHTSKSSPFLPEHSARAHSDTQITSTSCGVEGGGGDEGKSFSDRHE